MTPIIATDAASSSADWRLQIEALNAHEEMEIAAQIQHYPQPQAATIEALKIVQQHQGWVSDGKLKAIAQRLQMSPDEVESVATFYNKIYRQPVGRTVISLCDSVSCWIMGYQGLAQALTQELDISLGETTPDGALTLLPTPCLGACDHAPVAMIGNQRAHQLSPASVIILAQQARESNS
jgi:NADH-quinone oxidoreductase subunit E|tara:strand:+ start:3134 stop:3673 length:540 start_codon:yes stop_codon:yes gene_type:complete